MIQLSDKVKIAAGDQAERIELLTQVEVRLRWLSSWTIHNANHLRESRDGLKVGGHQASCASMTAIMAALYFHALRPNDRVAVKPHAAPVLHAIHYLLGTQSLDQLQRFRGFGGAQSYPSRTKDKIPVDFSTGSVGLGVAVTAFASLVQDFLVGHGHLAEADAGRVIALMGDAELDEGNIYECLIEGYKHDIRNCWWIVDYNRQSLDHTTADRMFRRLDDIFERGLDLGSVQGSGEGGRILLADVAPASARDHPAQSPMAPLVRLGETPLQLASPTTGSATPHRVLQLSFPRRTIAPRLSEPKQGAPHFYLTSHLRMDALMALREELNGKLQVRGDNYELDPHGLAPQALDREPA